MAESIIPQPGGNIPRHRAEIDIVWAMTVEGMPWPVPATVAALHQSRGEDTINPPRLYLRSPTDNSEAYLTITQAAHEHLDDIPPFDPSDRSYQLNAARMRITRACKRGDITCTKIDRKLRIHRDSFASWRLRWRQPSLEEADKT